LPTSSAALVSPGSHYRWDDDDDRDSDDDDDDRDSDDDNDCDSDDDDDDRDSDRPLSSATTPQSLPIEGSTIDHPRRLDDDDDGGLRPSPSTTTAQPPIAGESTLALDSDSDDHESVVERGLDRAVSIDDDDGGLRPSPSTTIGFFVGSFSRLAH
jgi:hypothetical protein